MADVLRLANEGQTSTVNLLAGTLKLRDGTWSTRTAPVEGGYNHVPFGAQANFSHFGLVVELMDLVGDDTTANLRAAQRDVFAVLEGARKYNVKSLWTRGAATSPPESWWLEWNVDGESVKRALIYEGSLSVLQGIGLSPMLEDSKMLARLAVTRHPFWESVSTATALNATNVSCWGGTTSLSSIPGDVPARWQSFFMGTPTAGVILTDGWIGIREKMSGITNFEPVWECEDGNTFNGSSVQTVSLASGGDVVQRASPASTLTKYWSMSVNDVCVANSHTDHNHQEGEYLVLCRCKVNSGTVGLQMRFGLESSSPALLPSEEVFITHTSWKLVELGRIQIPPDGIDEKLSVFNAAMYLAIEIWAEQVSGTSTLDLDALCLIPTHHLWTFTDAGIRVTDGKYIRATTTPNDKHAAYGLKSVSADASLQYSMENWYLPTDDSILVVAAQGSTVHSLTALLSITADYYSRWAMYRT